MAKIADLSCVTCWFKLVDQLLLAKTFGAQRGKRRERSIADSMVQFGNSNNIKNNSVYVHIIVNQSIFSHLLPEPPDILNASFMFVYQPCCPRFKALRVYSYRTYTYILLIA